MGARTVYLIPVEDELTAKAYREKVTRCLLDMGVIDEEEDEDAGGYLPGPRSLTILAKTVGAEDAFESCEVYGSRKARLAATPPASNT